EAEPVRNGVPEIVTVERFGWLAREIGMREKTRDMRGRRRPRPCQRAVDIGRPAGMAMHPIVDQRVPRPGVEGEDRLGVVPDPGDVADAAEVEDRDRLRHLGGERGVVERREWRSLTAGGNGAAAEIG